MTTMHFFSPIQVSIELFALHQFPNLGSYRCANVGSQYILLLAWPTSSSLDSLSLNVMLVGGFGTGNSALLGIGLIADGK
jgi:hypothetical protein